MTRVVCSDQRFVLARRGVLSEEEWQDFATHLSECPDCRLAWRLSTDFAATAAPKSGDERILDACVSQALRSSKRPSGALARVAVVALITLGVAGGASAAMVLHARYKERAAAQVESDGGGKRAAPRVRRGHGGGPPLVQPPPDPSAQRPGTTQVESTGVPSQSAAQTQRLPADAPVEPAAPAASSLSATPQTKQPPPLASGATARPRSRPTVSRSSSDPALAAGRMASVGPLAPEPQSGETAASLFARALSERQQGSSAAAVSTFQALQRRYPYARESIVSLVSLGDLMLASASHADALAAFEAYLHKAPAGALAPEALIGKAKALDGLGRAREASEAWADLARRFPGSAYARRAKSKDGAAP